MDLYFIIGLVFMGYVGAFLERRRVKSEKELKEECDKDEEELLRKLLKPDLFK